MRKIILEERKAFTLPWRVLLKCYNNRSEKKNIMGRSWVSLFTRFLDHTQRYTTFGRIPLDEWSAVRRFLYPTSPNTHNRQTSYILANISHDKGLANYITSGCQTEIIKKISFRTSNNTYRMNNNIHQRLRWSRGSVLAFSTRVRGFKPGRSRRIF